MKFTKEQLEKLESVVEMDGTEIVEIKCNIGNVWGDVRTIKGNVRVNVLGNVVGSVCGDVKGDVGSVFGSVWGDVYGNVRGCIRGNGS